MQYGICNLSLVPLRSEASDKSELTSQVLYGEHFKILEKRKKWSKIRLAFDNYEGWIDNKQFVEISKDNYNKVDQSKPKYSSDLVEFITDSKNHLHPIVLGSSLNALSLLNHMHDGNTINKVMPKKHLLETASLYLNAPYLWGGKSPFGIDCSGFTQIIYKIVGCELPRDASQQIEKGVNVSFIEEAREGDHF